jgi:hypothetical protein
MNGSETVVCAGDEDHSLSVTYSAPRRTQTGMHLIEIVLSVIHPAVATTGLSIPGLCVSCINYVVTHLHANRHSAPA